MEGSMRKSDKWIPFYFVLFFAVIMSLDGLFAYLAVSTEPGVVTENAYNQGVAYNKVIAEAEAEAARGWQGEINLTAPDRLGFTLKGKDSAALEGASVTAYLTRPTQKGYDFSLPLPETAPGIYGAPANFPLKGQWEARIVATWNGQQYQQSKRILVP